MQLSPGSSVVEHIIRDTGSTGSNPGLVCGIFSLSTTFDVID